MHSSRLSSSSLPLSLLRHFSSSSPAPTRIVIVGGVAGGASAAARARRLSETAQITLLEKGADVSFANCGLPYFIGEEITDRTKLSVHTPQSLNKLLNVEVKTGHEVVSIDRNNKTVTVKTVKGNQQIPYDKLVLSPGASPIKPPMKGIDDSRIFTLRTLQDMDAIKARMSQPNTKRITIIGAGFIGLEMCEAAVRLGKQVRLVEMQPQVLPQMDAEMVRAVEGELKARGVELVLGDGIDSFSPGNEEQGVAAVLKSGRRLDSDLVLLSIGVKPDSQLAEKAGLKLGVRGSIAVNEFCQTSDPSIYAAGDAVETADSVLEQGKRVNIALASPASRQARVIADHMFLPADKVTPYPGSIGTAIVRVFDMHAGTTGASEKRLKAEGIPYQTITVTSNQHASFYPGAVPLTLKMLWCPKSGKLLGAQSFGVDGVDKRLDVCATAIRGKMSVEQLVHLELSYAPPHGASRDVLNIAAFAASNVMKGLSNPIHFLPDANQNEFQLVDVRPAPNSAAAPIPGAINIPYEQLRDEQQLKKLDPTKPVVTICTMGKMAYFAQRLLTEKGFRTLNHVAGMHVANQGKNVIKKTTETVSSPPASAPSTPSCSVRSASSPAPQVLDACGLACPGPILRVKEALSTLAPGQTLVVKSTDGGFANDLPAFAQVQGVEFVSMDSCKGVYTGVIRKPSSSAAAPSTGSVVANVNGASRTGATIVVFSCDLDKVLASLVIANGSAAMSTPATPITLFFTFWGLNALRKQGPLDSNATAGKSMLDKMFGWMMPRGVDKLPLSQMHFGGMGTAMMKYTMRVKSLPNVPLLLAEAKKNNIRLVACSMSMEAMGIKKEELIDGVEIGGVAEFLAASAKTGTNLFI